MGETGKCKICGSPSMVMGYEVVRGKQVYRKVPFKSDAKGFTCGVCVAHGRLVSKKSEPQGKDAIGDLLEWRKAKKLTQAQVAELLGVSRPMVTMVERGEKVMPAGWEKALVAA